MKLLRLLVAALALTVAAAACTSSVTGPDQPGARSQTGFPGTMGSDGG